MKIYKPEWHCTFTVNEAAGASSSWRERLAWRIRRWADKLDHKGRTVTIECHVEPAVTAEEIDTCLVKGFEVTHSLLNQLAQQAACEDVMRDAKAELFEQGPPR
ncbi:MAG: hypothetical protein LPK20_12790 [Halomonas sp.]|jgi:hypothetical protein|uniref:Uncharacterized protein n=1 Tax=Billgrantia tianxiuensis TaxID=2497861 RepID=A0A6I6SHT2_9GAMM|nr:MULTISPECIES: hypothetical protein [Halomonas]MCE8033200.1 hypothetical protein [Halomonas sp. MCCC 1A11057]MDX5434440.1 hypothetical protein [Halomonas sp.]QHC48951.1 hypothetical protein EKK97_04095 [Halomonas tianxiuensis]